MGIISLVIPQIGQPDTTEDVKLQNALTTIQAVINGSIDPTNLTAAVSQSAGINASGQTVKGSSIVAALGTCSTTSYSTLSTPDQVTGIVLSSAGLIAIWYQATWAESVVNAGRAALFLGANEVQQAAQNAPSPTGGEAAIGGVAGKGVPLATVGGGGLFSVAGGTGYTGDVTTGQLMGQGGAGGPCYVFAPAGTYTVSVQFKASSGVVTVTNRRLYVQALSFA